jgi:hypothetical protein
LSDKDFKVKNKLQVKGITSAGPVVSDASGNLDSTAYVATQYGGTGTSTSPSSGQILYSSSGTTYAPTTLTSLDVKGATYSENAPSSPVVGQIWVESDSSSDSFDPNIIRRQAFTSTAAQTVYTTSIAFIEGYEQVYFNGLLLLRGTDYTTSNSNTVTLSAAAAVNDIVEVVTVTNLNSVDTYTQGEIDTSLALKANLSGGNTFSGRQTVSGGASGIDIEASSIIRSKNGFRVTGNNGTNEYQVGPFYNFTDFQITHSTDNFSTHTPRLTINTSGNIGIGNTSPYYKLSVNGTLNVYSEVAGLGRIFLGDPADTNGYIGIYRSSLGPANYNTAGNGLNFASIDGYVFSTASPPNYIYGVQSERMRIASDGTFSLQYVDASAPVLYNTANNNNKLMVFEGYASNKWNLWGGHGGGSYFGISENASSTPVFAITGSTNHVLVGYTSSQGSYKLQVNSQIFATSSSIATSDGRFKENVDTIDGGLGIIDSLRPVSFSWKDHPVHNFVEGKTVGFIAQEVQEALSGYEWVDNIIKTNTSEAVLDEEGNEVTPAEEFLGIAESNIIPLLVAAVKELKARVETLENNNV